MTDDGSIPVTDDKPACSCGSVLVFVKDRSEGGLVFWQCWTCGSEYVTRTPYRRPEWPLAKPRPLTWRKA